MERRLSERMGAGGLIIGKLRLCMCLLLMGVASSIGLWETDAHVSAESVDYENAVSINVNTPILGNVNNGFYTEVNTYRFETPADGTVQLHFQAAPLGNDGDIWTMKLYDGNGKTNVLNSNLSEIVATNIKGNATDVYSTKVGLPKGIYYIEVSSSNPGEAMSEETYTLTTGFEESDAWEKEFNNTTTEANNIAVNQNYYGTIIRGKYYEKDYYKFTLEKAGVVTVNFFHQLSAESSDSNVWDVEVFGNQNSSKTNSSYLTSETIKRNVQNTSFTRLGLDAGTYYLKVESVNPGEAISDSVYMINVGFEESTVWEKEFNDDPNHAVPINLETMYYGAITRGNYYEMDYFSFEVMTQGNYNISLSTVAQNDDDSYWDVVLYDSTNHSLVNFAVKGLTTYTSKKRVLSPGKYYVSVCSTNPGDARSTSPYQLQVSQVPAIQSFTATKTKMRYLKGEKLDTTDLVVKVKYITGQEQDVTSEATIDTSQVKMSENGTYNISITYDDLVTTVPITVYELSSISAKKTVVIYTQNDTLSTDDIVVTAEYSDKVTEDVTKDAKIDSAAVDMSKTGTYEIKATYKDKTTIIKIDVKSGSSSGDENANGEETTASTKKTLKCTVTAKSGKKKITVKTTKGAKVVVKSSSKIFYGYKKFNSKANSKGVAKIPVSVKLVYGTKLKVIITKSGYKKKQVTVTVS